MRGPGSIPTLGNILLLEFFHVVNPLITILPLLPILSICEILDCFIKDEISMLRVENGQSLHFIPSSVSLSPLLVGVNSLYVKMSFFRLPHNSLLVKMVHLCRITHFLVVNITNRVVIILAVVWINSLSFK